MKKLDFDNIKFLPQKVAAVDKTKMNIINRTPEIKHISSSSNIPTMNPFSNQNLISFTEKQSSNIENNSTYQPHSPKSQYDTDRNHNINQKQSLFPQQMINDKTTINQNKKNEFQTPKII